MKTNENSKKSPAELSVGLYRYKGTIYSIFNRDTWKKIPSDIRQAYEDKFENGKTATESDYNKFVFSVNQGNTKKIPLIDYRVINNSVLTQIEKSLSEGNLTEINIKGKKTRVTLKNVEEIREKIKRLLRKEKKEQNPKNNKDSYLLAFFNVKEFEGKTVIDFAGANSDKYEDYLDEIIY